MRAGSLSKEPVFSLLRNRYVCGYRDISNERYAGNSGSHGPGGAAVETTNGAGPHNVQLFVMNPDGTVLHCLPGYWHPDDLAAELALAERLNSVYMDRSSTPEQKTGQFKRMQMDHIRSHSSTMVARSQMQSFDKRHEAGRGKSDTIRDTALVSESWGDGKHHENDGFKTTDEILHERMSARPFMAYAQFDVARFSDYGSHFYDKHEDALDENGRNTDPEAKATLIKGGHRGGHRGGHVHAGRVPKMQVKTYGSVRRTSWQNTQ